MQDHNISVSRGLLGRWINFSKTVSNSSSCSVQKMMNILRTALEPSLEPEEPEPREMESEVEIFPVAPVKKERGQERDLDMKMRYTARLKQALYQSIKQHAGWQ